MKKSTKQIPVLFYHSVAFRKDPRWIKNFLTLELFYFEDFLKYLKRNKYSTVNLDYYISAKKGEIKDISQKICITFDDGYVDNWIFVYPLLKKYGFTATIFINPENIDKSDIVRNTLYDFWDGRVSADELEQSGFLTWNEIELMHKSGVVDFQSHTMSHTKYFVSDEIIGFHTPGSKYVYPIWNQFPGSSKNYFDNPKFEQKIPYGYPIFKELSSIIAKKVTISNDFIKQAIELFVENKEKKLSYAENLEQLFNFRNEYLKKKSIITDIEPDEVYQKRVLKELSESKNIIEQKLQKQVKYCCWPHGENSTEVHEIALKIGYSATTIGKLKINPQDPTRIQRFAVGAYKNSRLYSLSKARFKLHAYEGKQPYYFIQNIFRKVFGKI